MKKLSVPLYKEKDPYTSTEPGFYENAGVLYFRGTDNGIYALSTGGLKGFEEDKTQEAYNQLAQEHLALKSEKALLEAKLAQPIIKSQSEDLLKAIAIMQDPRLIKEIL